MLDLCTETEISGYSVVFQLCFHMMRTDMVGGVAYSHQNVNISGNSQPVQFTFGFIFFSSSFFVFSLTNQNSPV